MDPEGLEKIRERAKEEADPHNDHECYHATPICEYIPALCDEVERLRSVLKALPGAWADHTGGPYEETCEKCRFLKMRADALEGGN